MDIRNFEKDSHYRNCLGINIGKTVKLHCSKFELRTREDGKKFLLLHEPEIIKISYKNGKQKYPIKVHHLWVCLPEEFEPYLPVARKIEITGTIKEYPYAEKGTKQVGVAAKSARVVKYKKEIAKKYNLRPYETPPITFF